MTDKPVVIVGGGLAGLAAALSLAKQGIKSVVLQTPQNNSGSAQSGLAAPLSERDSIDLFLKDINSAGAVAGDNPMARKVVESAQDAVRKLEQWGVTFDRTDNGDHDFSKGAGHSMDRLLHTGITTGASVMNTLKKAVKASEYITVVEGNAYALDHDDAGVQGVYYTDKNDTVQRLNGSHVMLATGGIGHLWLKTTNSKHATGTGLVMAAGVDAALKDMHLMQFHPTAIDLQGKPSFLLGEALRGKYGAKVVFQKPEGTRWQGKDPSMYKRDVLSTLIVNMSLPQSGGWTAYLDVAGVTDSAAVQKLQPQIRKHGLLLPITPAAHFHMGGVAVNEHWQAINNNNTVIPGLYVIGEAAATGMHGENRVAGNALLEATVSGVLAVQYLASDGYTAGASRENVSAPVPPGKIGEHEARTRELMYLYAGVLCKTEGLTKAAEGLQKIAESIIQVDCSKPLPIIVQAQGLYINVLQQRVA